MESVDNLWISLMTWNTPKKIAIIAGILIWSAFLNFAWAQTLIGIETGIGWVVIGDEADTTNYDPDEVYGSGAYPELYNAITRPYGSSLFDTETLTPSFKAGSMVIIVKPEGSTPFRQIESPSPYVNEYLRDLGYE